jgi:tetratricopeptide (TPR) repeat protein
MPYRPACLLALPLLLLAAHPAAAQHDIRSLARSCISAKTPAEAISGCEIVISTVQLLGPSFVRGYMPEEEMASVYGTRGSAYFQEGRLDEALRDLDSAIAIAPLAVAYYQRGRVHAQRDRPEAAIADLTRAIEIGLRKQLPLAHKIRGVVYLATHRHEQAKDDFRRSIELDEKDADAHVLLAMALERGGDPRLAILSYRAALFVNPAHKDARSALERLGVDP